MKQFQGTCVGNPFNSVEELCSVIDEAHEIKMGTFIRNCKPDPELKKEFRRFPRDFTFHKNRGIYFYTWSMIEHFYYGS
ncbi:hypothetical protein LCGC14_1341400 [marine sediment metagenome]|uniref:Uncharacterized protein n=1 Tax=marine sediment metagenome TaxID=412755 RepID=A0A0F9KDI7_9ZZZZ